VKTQDVQALLDGATKGPWSWCVSKVAKRVDLEGDRGDKAVMSFTRYGMSGAAPVFYFWEGNTTAPPKRADELACPVAGREHHASWFCNIDHPDARLIAAAPTLAADLIAANAEIERLRDALDQVAHCSAYTRHGGASEGDLGSYEKGLDTAIEIATQALETTP
jgi:hypothetical protein